LLNWVDNSTQEAGFTVQRALDANFTLGVVTVAQIAALPGTGTVTYTDTTVSRNSTYYYRVATNGEVVGDVTMPAFPTMSADSFSNVAGPINTFSIATLPAAPTAVSITVQAGPQVSMTFRDNANNESGFVLERCSFVAPATTCNTFGLIATLGPRNNTGNVTYVDNTVTGGNGYVYRVAAFNAGGNSAYATLGTVSIAVTPDAPINVTVAVVRQGANDRVTITWEAPVNPATFTIQRARNLSFTTGLTTSTVSGTARTFSQTVARNTTFYYRIRANNGTGDSSAWTNALPFPIRTP
jgi:hypothetical protein